MKKEGFHPYKQQFQYLLSDDDPDHCMQICEWFLNHTADDPDFPCGKLFWDENFFM